MAAENWKERRPKEELASGMTSEIYLLEHGIFVAAAMVTSELRKRQGLRWGLYLAKTIDDMEPVGLATNMKRGPADESRHIAVVGSIWGFGDKMDGTVINYIQFAE